MTDDAFHRAYFAPPIASIIAVFQEGLHFDMLAMLNLKLPPHLARGVYPIDAFAGLAKVLDQWLDEYGLSRLPRLFAYVQEIHAIMLLHATYSGRVDVMEFALKHRGVTPAMMMLLIDVAAWKNQRRVLDFFRQHPHASGWTCSSFALVAAAREGHLDIVRFLHEQFPMVSSTEDAMDMAAEFGHLDVVQFLHQHRSEGCTTRAMNHAAKNGHLEVLRFLQAHRSEGCTEQAMELACEQGHLDVAQWLVEHRSREGFTEKAFDKAAGNNHMAVVEFLHRLQALSTEKAMDLAAGNGHLSMVQWLHQHRPLQRCTEEAMDDAAANGHLDVVEWLHKHRSEGGTPDGFCNAAGAGHVDVLQWITANRPNLVCTNKSLQMAVEKNQVGVVEWLLNRDHDVPLFFCAKPGRSVSVDLIELLRQHHPQVQVLGHFIYAVGAGDLNVVEWIVNHGEHDLRAIDVAASFGHLHVVQWLHARSFPATTDAMDNACRNGHLHVVWWLHRHRSESCTRYAMTGAIENGHFSIVMWLHRHRLHDLSNVEIGVENAAAGGDLTLVEYLHMHYVNESTTLNIVGAFDGGHFSVVQYLHRHRLGNLSYSRLDSTVWCGYLELAKWLVATTEVSITDDTLEAAVNSGDLTMLKWVLSHWTGNLDSWPVDIAAGEGRLSMIQCLWESGFEWTEYTMDSAAANGHLAVMLALEAHGVPCTSNDVALAAEGAMSETCGSSTPMGTVGASFVQCRQKQE